MKLLRLTDNFLVDVESVHVAIVRVRESNGTPYLAVMVNAGSSLQEVVCHVESLEQAQKCLTRIENALAKETVNGFEPPKELPLK